MRSLTFLRTKRINGPRKFRSSPQKDFCNSICHRGDIAPAASVAVHRTLGFQPTIAFGLSTNARLAHLLCGVPLGGAELKAPDLSALALPAAAPVPGALDRLERRLAALEARVLELEQQLGLGPTAAGGRPEQE